MVTSRTVAHKVYRLVQKRRVKSLQRLPTQMSYRSLFSTLVGVLLHVVASVKTDDAYPHSFFSSSCPRQIPHEITTTLLRELLASFLFLFFFLPNVSCSRLSPIIAFLSFISLFLSYSLLQWQRRLWPKTLIISQLFLVD